MQKDKIAQGSGGLCPVGDSCLGWGSVGLFVRVAGREMSMWSKESQPCSRRTEGIGQEQLYDFCNRGDFCKRRCLCLLFPPSFIEDLTGPFQHWAFTHVSEEHPGFLGVHSFTWFICVNR